MFQMNHKFFKLTSHEKESVLFCVLSKHQVKGAALN